MSDPTTASDRCYRHPDRQSYILCQRCGRTICPECQTPAPVGFQCPECMRESRASAPRTKPAIVTSVRGIARDGGPIVTYSIIAVTAFVYLLQLIPGLGDIVTSALFYPPVLTAQEPWRLLTSVFVHSPSSFFHVLFNMFSLFIFGRILESAIGRWRFLALYLISGLGGSVAVLLLEPSGGVLGASGAIFGIMGALLVIQRGLGGNATGLLVLVGLNLAAGFFIQSISWQAHIGGVITGALIGLIYVRTRGVRQQRRQTLLMAGLTLAIIVIASAGYVVRVLA